MSFAPSRAFSAADTAWNGLAHESNPLHPAPRFRLTPFNEIMFFPEHNALIKGLIPRDGLVVVYGPPKCGKSFWTLDAMMSVAMGWTYRDRRVVQGAVVYIACEGERGLNARIEAFRKKYLKDTAIEPAFYLVATRLNLVEDCEELISAIQAQIKDQGVVAITVDTLNRSFSGSESDDRAMGDYIKAADAVREAFSCTVIIIHHCGHEGTRPRGHSSLIGAADAQIAVSSIGRDIRAKLEYLKDGEADVEICSRLEVVEIGIDSEGDRVTSCVIVPADEGHEKAPILIGQTKSALEQLRCALRDAGERSSSGGPIPDGIVAVREKIWRGKFYQVFASKKQETKQKAFNRAKTALQKSGHIRTRDGWVWLLSQPDTGQKPDMSRTCLSQA